MAEIVQHKPVTHRWWFRAVLLVLFMLPAITEFPYDPANTTVVIQSVLAEPFVVAFPELLPLAKLLLGVAVILPFIGIVQAGRILLGYYASILAVVSVLQNMAHTESWGFVWLLGNTVVQSVVVFWCVLDVAQHRSRLLTLRPVRLWLLIPILLALLMPYAVRDGAAVPAWHTVLGNEAGVTYCMITSVILGTMLMFPAGVDHRTLSVVSFVGLIFGLINLVVWFGLAPHSWWMGILHLPLVVTTVFGLIEARIRTRKVAIDTVGGVTVS